ncbi:MAG: HD domain-containing protein [Lachnospiraceae bacterium]|nr:HD domain-containing protein [Lachnospiraceae bacterium]
MKIKLFAAIDVGSYEIAMKIFQFSSKSNAKHEGSMKEIDHIRHRIELGTDTYATGKISYARMDELCRILREFVTIMQTYKVDAYKAYATSAVRETENTMIILDQIRIRTGIDVEVLSNSEQRFLDYKSIASKGEGFHKIMEKGTAIADLGGGSMQLSLFDKDSLVTTQNIRVGVLRIRETMNVLKPRPSQAESLLEEMIDAQLNVFKKLYLKDREIKNIIVVDDYVSGILQKSIVKGMDKAGYIDRQCYLDFVEDIKNKMPESIARTYGIAAENAQLLQIAAVIIQRLLHIMDVELIWAPGVTLCDGIAYEYAEREKLITSEHNFEQDIIACAGNISKRYMGSKKRSETLEKIALTIFDSMKKVHGLGRRERLLLQLCTLMHDCGKYINMSNLGECSYNIISSTEIIGLSHREREMVAHVVKYNHTTFPYYEGMGQHTLFDKQEYLVIAKLTAILRVANGLDRSHRQKFKNIKARLMEDELRITVDTLDDITLERELLNTRADFFEEVFSVRPVIKQKKVI